MATKNKEILHYVIKQIVNIPKVEDILYEWSRSKEAGELYKAKVLTQYIEAGDITNLSVLTDIPKSALVKTIKSSIKELIELTTENTRMYAPRDRERGRIINSIKNKEESTIELIKPLKK